MTATRPSSSASSSSLGWATSARPTRTTQAPTARWSRTWSRGIKGLNYITGGIRAAATSARSSRRSMATSTPDAWGGSAVLRCDVDRGDGDQPRQQPGPQRRSATPCFPLPITISACPVMATRASTNGKCRPPTSMRSWSTRRVRWFPCRRGPDNIVVFRYADDQARRCAVRTERGRVPRVIPQLQAPNRPAGARSPGAYTHDHAGISAPMNFVQVLVNSLITASELGIIAIGLTLTLSLLRFANFAHVETAVAERLHRVGTERAARAELWRRRTGGDPRYGCLRHPDRSRGVPHLPKFGRRGSQ